MPTAKFSLGPPAQEANGQMKRLIPSEPSIPQSKASTGPPEDELDALLDKVEEKQASRAAQPDEEPPDAIETFRSLMREVYIPTFETVQAKYASKGISMTMDVDEFLGGGSSLKIRLAHGEVTMELDGTVMRGGVAFYIIHGIGQNKGAVVSGPLLRIRTLSSDGFRQFLAGHLSQLIKDVLRQT